MRFPLLTALLLLLPATTHAQWQIQDAHTTSDLRGIDNVGGGVAWASGTHGTVLRTEDAGFVWQLCTIPPGAEYLDFRGIQAFDNNTALVMSSGKGDLSRLYKTTDGCQTWKLVFTNPDAPEGFFDQLLMIDAHRGILFGDPAPASERNLQAGSSLRVRLTSDGGERWIPVTFPGFVGKAAQAPSQESLFAASNSSASVLNGWLWMGTGSGWIFRSTIFTKADFQNAFRATSCMGAIDSLSHSCPIPWSEWLRVQSPLASEGAAAGVFSLHFKSQERGVAVGGNYQLPTAVHGTAAFTTDMGLHWLAATTPPHGYRSAVAYDPTHNTWITVGPNGTDISTDDGRNWRPLKPSPTDPPDADQHWNALSLPFVVGPHGRIGTLRPEALSAKP